MEFGLLGPLWIRGQAGEIELGAPKQRALLIALLLRVGHSVPVDRLIDALWEDAPPGQARVTLRSYVSNLRRVFERPEGDPIIVTSGNGYSIQVEPEAIDAVRFERLARTGRDRLRSGDPQGALDDISSALELWRGEALVDVADLAFAHGELTRLEELRRTAEEDRFDALLAMGRHGEAVAPLEAFTSAHWLRERARGQLMLALHRSGRTPDALASFRQFRESLAEELGLDPSPQLAELADDILRRSGRLEPPPPEAAAPVLSVPETGAEEPTRMVVGRVHERGELAAAVERLRAGEGGLLLFAGEPGIGKTTLLEELERLASGAGITVHWGRCPETEGAPAYWPWIQVLRDVARGVSDDELVDLARHPAAAVTHVVDEIARRLGEQQPVVGDDLRAARFELHDAVATFLVRTAERAPRLILLEDLHWADPPSLQLLSFVTPLLRAGRVLIAGSYRDVPAEWTPELEAALATVVRDRATRQFGLAGLHPGAVAELAARLTGSALEAQEARELHARTAGNPFFVSQLARLREEGGPAGPQVPQGVRHVILHRLGPLPDSTRRLLATAAVIGRRVPLRHLAAACGLQADEVLATAAPAVAAGLLEADGRPVTGYGFVHALVRETIYESLEAGVAVHLHADVAKALATFPEVPAVELAEHFWQAAEVVEDDRAVRYLVAAADEALAVLAHEHAEISLRRALELAERDGDRTRELELRVRLLQLSIALHGWAADLVEDLAAPAIDLARSVGFAPGVVPSWIALLSAYTSHGEQATARALAAELVELATEADEPAAGAAGHLGLAYVDLIVGRDPDEALEQLACAERLAGLAPPEQLQATPHLSVSTAYLRGVALAHRGDVSGALQEARRATLVAGEVGDPLSQAIAHMVAAVVGIVVENPGFTREFAAAGLDLCGERGFRYVGHLLTLSDAWARARLGDDPGEQAERMGAALAAIERQRHADPGAKALLFAAETYLLAGDRDGAIRRFREALELSGRTSEYLPVERVRRLRAELGEVIEPA